MTKAASGLPGRPLLRDRAEKLRLRAGPPRPKSPLRTRRPSSRRRDGGAKSDDEGSSIYFGNWTRKTYERLSAQVRNRQVMIPNFRTLFTQRGERSVERSLSRSSVACTPVRRNPARLGTPIGESSVRARRSTTDPRLRASRSSAGRCSSPALSRSSAAAARRTRSGSSRHVAERPACGWGRARVDTKTRARGRETRKGSRGSVVPRTVQLSVLWLVSQLTEIMDLFLE